MIEIYTDGACRNNQQAINQGGWGLVLTDMYTGKIRHCWGHQADTTNNRMEMTAAIKALEAIRNRPRSEVTIYSDSNLLIQGMNEWMTGWKAKGWKNASKKPVGNKDLWLLLDELSGNHDVTWRYVKGHNGDVDNELADKLANRGADGGNGWQDFEGGELH
ncbi:MAG: ribonuclease HI [Motiliproteus sp.]